MSDDFRVLEGLLRLTSFRHGLIASNIANTDTPEYHVRDLRFEQALDGETTALKVTNARHLSPAGSALQPDIVTAEGQPWGDGNNVELDLEVAKMTENALLHQAGVTMLATRIRMFKNALRRQ